MKIRLPEPKFKGIPLEEAIRKRRTIRSFLRKPISLDHLSQLLWAGYGSTEGFRRTVPSAGALYPMDLYVAIGEVEGVEKGVYHYIPAEHSLTLIHKEDVREDIAKASLYQMWMADAAVSFVITAEYRRITVKYGERGIRYAIMEAGNISQNIFLQAESLGLGAGIVGAFHDDKIMQIMRLPKNHHPLLIMPVGKKL